MFEPWQSKFIWALAPVIDREYIVFKNYIKDMTMILHTFNPVSRPLIIWLLYAYTWIENDSVTHICTLQRNNPCNGMSQCALRRD